MDQCNLGKMYGSMECGAICYNKRNDDMIQGHLLLSSTIHATKTTKMGIEGIVFSGCKIKICRKF